MNKFFLAIIIVLLFFLSCDEEQDSGTIFNYPLETQWSNVNIENLSRNDTIIIFAEFNFKAQNAQSLIISVPSNVNFKAFLGDTLIANKTYGEICNLNKQELKEYKTPITPYNVPSNFYLNASQITTEKIRFEVFKTVPKKGSENLGIKLFYSTSKKEEKIHVDFTNQVKTFFSESKLPIININTEGALSDDTKVVADFFVVDNLGGNNSLKDTATIKGKAKIKIRGSSSKALPKQSYLFKTYDDSLSKKEISLLGLPKESEWVLYAPFIDYSLMRNVLGYKLHRKMENYSPRTKYFHLIINNDYRGIYVLVERIKRGKNRINVAKQNKKTIDKDSITGGYIVKLDKGKGEAWASAFKSNIDSGFGKWFIHVYPKSKNLNQAQRDFIRGYIASFETALLNGGNWDDYIKTKSFIDYMIMMEVTKNVDGYRLSTFYSKDRGGKLKADPLWDLNLSFGLTSYYDGYKTEGFMYKDKASPFWWQYFMQNPKFKKAFKARWKELRKTVLSEKAINHAINEEVNLLQSDIHYNTEKWMSYKETSNWRKEDQTSFKGSISYLKNWIKKRNAYLDSIFLQL